MPRKPVGQALKLDKSTVWQWRLKAACGFAVTDRTKLLASIETGIVMLRESRKASRKWVNHRRDPATHAKPDRLRWVDYRRLGLVAPDHLPRYRIPVAVSVDRVGRYAAEVLHSLASEPISADPAADQPAARGATTLPTSRKAASMTGRPSPNPPRRAGEVTRVLAELGRFLRRFCGPATRHLPADVAWFNTRKKSGELAGAMTAGCPTNWSLRAPD